MAASRREHGTDEPRSGVQSVERALGILQLYQDGPAEQTITEISRQTGLNLSTAHRIVKALCRAQFMEQDPSSERYRLGAALLALGRRALETSGFAVAMPVLDDLAERLGESASLGIRRQESVVVVLASASQHRLRFDHEPGTSIALHASAMGKVLLAYSASPPASAVAGLGDLEQFTPSTVTSTTELASELERILRDGYAVNREERYAGVVGVAAPVLNRSGRAVAAVGVQGPVARISTNEFEALAQSVRGAADEIARRLAPGRAIG